MLCEILADEGYAVLAVADGQQALAHVLETPPDLILTDLMLPLLDGRTLLARVQAHAHLAHIPVLLMSAAGRMRAGERFAAFLAKPFSIDDLLREIRRHLP